jgi:hypothetical protein
MADENAVLKQRNRTEELKFISKRLTPYNPQNEYYINLEETYKSYYILVLVGTFMVLYFLFF